jgi:hypothetical protein
MSYFMRFFIESDQAPAEDDLAALFDQAGAGVKYADGVAYRDDEDLAVIEVNRRGEELFDDDVAEFRHAMAEIPDGPGKARVERCLDTAGAVVAVQVLFGDRDEDETLGALDPLWEALFARYGGLLQADAEGFYDAERQVLELE